VIIQKSSVVRLSKKLDAFCEAYNGVKEVHWYINGSRVVAGYNVDFLRYGSTANGHLVVIGRTEGNSGDFTCTSASGDSKWSVNGSGTDCIPYQKLLIKTLNVSPPTTDPNKLDPTQNMLCKTEFGIIF